MPIQWSEKHSMGVKEIDDQHKAFIETLNNLYSAVNSGKLKDELEKILVGLVNYASNHFATEEKYFDLYQYENAAEHKEEHRKLKAKVADFYEKLQKGEMDITLDLLDFLEDWLVDHLEKQDWKYKECFRKNGLR